MRIFINNVDTYVGNALCADLWKADAAANRLFGTVLGLSGGVVPPSVRRIVARSKPSSLLKTLMSCSLVVYDLHTADLEEVEFIIKTLKSTEVEREITFVLISSVMVWAKTTKAMEPKKAEGEEGEEEAEPPAEEGEGGGEVKETELRPVAFTDDDFEKRQPAPKYIAWKTLETLALSLTSVENVRPFVICAGILYGNGEGTFQNVFKAAWLSEQTHRIVGPGKNHMPTLHVRDLARSVKALAGNPPEKKYLIAVDAGDETQASIVEGVVSNLGGGYDVPRVTPEEAALEDTADVLTVDLRFKRSAPLSDPDFNWWSKGGIVKGIGKVAAEFCRWRGLRAIKAAIVGPPGSGKSFHAQTVAEHFNVPHLKIADIIKDFEEDPKKDEWAEEVMAKKAEYVENTKDKKGAEPFRYDTITLAKIVQRRLQANVCRYRGFILDGYPRSFEEVEAAFLKKKVKTAEEGEEAEAEEAEEGAGAVETKPEMEAIAELIPEFVVSLRASEEFCKLNVMSIPAAEAEGTHNTEDGFKRRFAKWVQTNETPEVPPVVECFQNQKIEVLELPLQDKKAEEVFASVRIYIEKKGRPFNYLKSEKELAAERKLLLEQVEKTMKQREAEGLELQEKFEEEARERRRLDDEARLREIQEHERRQLLALSLPLRSYLMQYIVPTLTEGLIELCQIMPDDPIDHLAEFLFSKAGALEGDPNVDPATFMSAFTAQQHN
uniref:Adenylate kinase 7 n=1 Tax=Chromera velia CCMP2878 TaxID=1169474 RepID=A0A0G4FVB2_9ALVE|eukprot:Cvel_18858.t1-p1 / transcript=Cvel_18858.t1 / gene=Cvel_18858 / organism=Chromera_velia_CCMP2878 / gene_product=Adenylate kinase 7, putative / transcript_product=Adenylate kinase 7, putative / location=Cvel_scaffold1586:20872-28765(+) / protein_length=719 / sequence_SO=supercontig / SO=protein_coding / is_pseudo=false